MEVSGLFQNLEFYFENNVRVQYIQFVSSLEFN